MCFYGTNFISLCANIGLLFSSSCSKVKMIHFPMSNQNRPKFWKFFTWKLVWKKKKLYETYKTAVPLFNYGNICSIFIKRSLNLSTTECTLRMSPLILYFLRKFCYYEYTNLKKYNKKIEFAKFTLSNHAEYQTKNIRTYTVSNAHFSCF